MSNVSTVRILTPPVTSDLTLLDTVREELDITDRKHDKKLIRWIHNASAAVQDYLQRPLGIAQYEEEFQHEQIANVALRRYGDPWKLRLRYYPITRVDSVQIDDQVLDPIYWDFNADGFMTKLHSSSVPWLAEFGQLGWTGGYGSWQQPGREVTITYWAGYELIGDLPRAIETAVLTAIRHRWAIGSRDPTLRSESVGQILSQSYWNPTSSDNAALPQEAVSLLQPYREISI
jgi:hypothetical protein